MSLPWAASRFGKSGTEAFHGLCACQFRGTTHFAPRTSHSRERRNLPSLGRCWPRYSPHLASQRQTCFACTVPGPVQPQLQSQSQSQSHFTAPTKRASSRSTLAPRARRPFPLFSRQRRPRPFPGKRGRGTPRPWLQSGHGSPRQPTATRGRRWSLDRMSARMPADDGRSQRARPSATWCSSNGLSTG
jgi:hypothetical protein